MLCLVSATSITTDEDERDEDEENNYDYYYNLFAVPFIQSVDC